LGLAREQLGSKIEGEFPDGPTAWFRALGPRAWFPAHAFS
jgi:hypothetical protein